jgi:hypothetical protein
MTHMTRTGSSLCLLTALIFLAWPASGASGRAADWSVSAIITDTRGGNPRSQRILRIGFENRASSPRLLCVESMSYGTEAPEEARGGAQGGTPSCTGIEYPELVLGNQTLFRVLAATPGDLDNEDAVLRVEVTISDASLGGGAAPRQMRLRWKGTIREAIAATGRLTK